MAAPKERKRDGRYLEILGHYVPTQTPAVLVLKSDRMRSWVERGAHTTRTVQRLVAKELPGFFKERADHKRSRIQALRKKRKERAKAGASKAPKKATKKSAKK